MSDSDHDFWVPRPARIVRTRALTERERFFRLRPLDDRPLGHRPGQFVQVSIPGIGEAPISIASAPTNRHAMFELVVRRVGNLTTALHEKKAGDIVHIRGPFGRGFDLDAMRERDILLVAGGLGIVPLRSLIQYVLTNRKQFGRFCVLYGARRPAEFLFLDELVAWIGRPDADFYTTVNVGPPGYLGQVGLITSLIPYADLGPRTVAVVLGPPVMFRHALRALVSRGLSPRQIWLSLERRMRCGMGQCGHCQIDSALACVDGPVFRYDELEALPEAI